MAKACELAIVGSGPAGYTAAIYAARALIEPLLITGLETGGQLTITTDVENYPGFADPVQGPWLMQQMGRQAENVGAQILNDTVARIDLSRAPFALRTEGGQAISARAVILATGARARWLGVPGEDTFKGLGVSACATCDGFFFRDKPVVVVGGGNTAVEEALYLASLASHVTLVHRRGALRADAVLQKRLNERKNIDIVWHCVVSEITGDTDPPRARAVMLRDVRDSDATPRRLEADGIFIAIGHEPQTGLVRGQLELTSSGYVKHAPDSTQTSQPGVFAAGDVSDDTFRQAVTAAGFGCMAALEAQRYLSAATSHG